MNISWRTKSQNHYEQVSTVVKSFEKKKLKDWKQIISSLNKKDLLYLIEEDFKMKLEEVSSKIGVPHKKLQNFMDAVNKAICAVCSDKYYNKKDIANSIVTRACMEEVYEMIENNADTENIINILLDASENSSYLLCSDTVNLKIKQAIGKKLKENFIDEYIKKTSMDKLICVQIDLDWSGLKEDPPFFWDYYYSIDIKGSGILEKKFRDMLCFIEVEYRNYIFNNILPALEPAILFILVKSKYANEEEHLLELLKHSSDKIVSCALYHLLFLLKNSCGLYEQDGREIYYYMFNKKPEAKELFEELKDKIEKNRIHIKTVFNKIINIIKNWPASHVTLISNFIESLFNGCLPVNYYEALKDLPINIIEKIVEHKLTEVKKDNGWTLLYLLV